MKDYTEELKLIYKTITVEIPGVDSANFKAIDEILFIMGINNLIKIIHADAYTEGFNDAKDEIKQVIRDSFNFKAEL